MKRKLFFITTMFALTFTVLYFFTDTEAKRSKKIKLSTKNVVMHIGQKQKIKVNTKVKWKSSNKKIASVNAKGIVTAKKVGNVTITARKAKKKAICKIRVVKASNNTATSAPTAAPTTTPITTPTTAPSTAPSVTPSVSPTPTATSEPSYTPAPSPSPSLLAIDVWLLFSVDQDKFTTNTSSISGIMQPYENTVIKIKVNDTLLTEKSFDNNVSTYTIDTDFSGCKIGDKMTITREYLGDNIQQTDTETIAIHNETKTFYIS